MNGMPGWKQQAFWKTGMMLASQAYVSDVRVIDQRVHVDCYDSETGEQWFRLPLLVFGGGPDSSLVVPPKSFSRKDLQQPEEEGGAQVLVLPRFKQGPVALGGVQHPISGYQNVDDLTDDEKQPADGAEHPLPTTVDDHIWRHAGVRLQLTSDGSLVIDTTESTKPVRIQLSDSSRMRVSRGGQAGGRLTLWGKLRDYIVGEFQVEEAASLAGSLVEWGINVFARLSALEANVDTIRNSLLLPTTGADPIITAAEFAQLLDHTTASGEPDLEFPAPPDMGAAAIDVSQDVD
jgi:hypothetical protein